MVGVGRLKCVKSLMSLYAIIFNVMRSFNPYVRGSSGSGYFESYITVCFDFPRFQVRIDRCSQTFIGVPYVPILSSPLCLDQRWGMRSSLGDWRK